MRNINKLMKAFAIVIACTLLTGIVSGCKKNEGNIRFTNTSGDPYVIYLDGRSEGTLFGNSFIEFKVMEGDHAVEAIQQSGFVLSPNDVKQTMHVYAGSSTEFVFP